MSYVFWLSGLSVASAQEAPSSETEGEELPLAIPVPDPEAPASELQTPPSSAPRTAEARPGRETFRTYRDQALSLRTVGEVRVGTTWDYTTYGRWGPYGYSMGWSPWPRPYVVQTSRPGVFQGPKRLDVPSTLLALGDEDARVALEGRIRKNRTIGNVGYGLGVVGVAASVVGLIGLDECCSTPIYAGDTERIHQALAWSTVTGSGLALMVGGLVGGTFPSVRAWRLQYDHTATIEPDVLEERIEAHNAQLATELGLTAREVERIESRPRRAP